MKRLSKSLPQSEKEKELCLLRPALASIEMGGIPICISAFSLVRFNIYNHQQQAKRSVLHYPVIHSLLLSIIAFTIYNLQFIYLEYLI
jgi:hypothetical protein